MNDAGSAAPARRGNGLRADDYVRVARPTLAVAEAALDALRRTGIAARITGTSATGGRDSRCELWADAHELDDAATVLSAVVRHAGVPDTDLGAVGEEMALLDLADLGLLDPTPVTADDHRPDGDLDVELDLDDHGDPAGTRNPTPSARPYPTPSRPRASRPRPPDRPLDTGDDDDFDPDDHYLPGEPESLRSLSRTTVWALAILAVGVLALALSGLAPTLVGGYAPLASLLGTAAVLVGVGMLVTRLRDGRRDDGDDRGGPNGDGAVL